jgi:hypothetical protein
MNYRPTSLRVGGLSSALVLFGIVAFAAVRLVRARRERTQDAGDPARFPA